MGLGNVEEHKLHFPNLEVKVHGKKLTYLDSAATTLKPQTVISRIAQYYMYENSNIHRGAHFLADQGTKNFESTRTSVKNYINASSENEIIFVRGTTEAINLVASSWGQKNLKNKDEILISKQEHHANIVPWQLVAEKTGATIREIPVDKDGELLFSQNLISENTKLVAITHCSNVMGYVNQLDEIIERAHSVGARVLVDGAQYVSFDQPNMKNINCDFYVFSSHKMFGPTGVGILYAKDECLREMPPYQGGGSMIDKVSLTEGTTFLNAPHKFEAGTPDIAGVVAFNEAIEFIQKIGIQNIRDHKKIISEKCVSALRKISGIKVLNPKASDSGIVSFNLEGAHHSDVGQILDHEGVAVRTGHHCAMPLMQALGLKGSVRASFSIYNDEKDIDTLVSAIIKAKEMLL